MLLQSAIRNPQSKIGRSAIEKWSTTADGLASNWVVDIHQASDGRMWIATVDGLTEFDGERFRSHKKQQGLSENHLTALAEDRAGNLWIGSESNGALRLVRNGFISYTEADGLGHNRINSIFETQSGELYVVSDQININRLDGRRFTAVRPNLPQQITNLGWGWHQITFQDRAGEWWVATGQGLCRFSSVGRVEQLAHLRPKVVYTMREGLSGNEVFRLFEDLRGDIWIGTISPGPAALTRWERRMETFHRYCEADGIPSTVPTAFSEDRSGHLWIGFYDGGLARYHDGRFKLFTAADGVPAGMIRGLYLDRAGRLWVGSNGGGVGRLDDPTADRPRFVAYTTANGLASNSVWSITEDQWGRIYIETSRGVNRLDPATDRLAHYTSADGLAMNEVRAAYRDRHGALWFGTLQGLSQLIPEPDQPASPPPILITGLRIEGSPVSISELGETDVSGLELEPSQNHVQIDFVSLSFAAGQGLRYQYKLDGDDEDWGAPSDHRTVNYANLSPGTYRFLVRAVSADDLVSPTPAAVAFTILPPIWQRWWFLTLAALVGGLVIYAIHRVRVARLLELERVRTRIATDLHDDIGASLSRMAILSEVVKQQKADHPQSVELLTEIAETGRALMEAMSDVVWSIDPRRDDLKSLVYRIRQFASDVLEAKHIKWEFQTPPSLEAVKLTPEQRRHVFLIFKEAITNIVRHANCASVSLTITVVSHRLVAEIGDDGCGFVVPQASDSLSQQRQGNGLVNMQARAAELGGRFSIDSAPGRGTRLTLMIPLK